MGSAAVDTRGQLLLLSEAERRDLLVLARRHTAAHQTVVRARIVLFCAELASDADVAARLQVSVRTVARWRRRFQEEGLAGLADRPRAGAPARIPRDKVQQIIGLTLAPRAVERSWTVREMARRTAVSPTSVWRIWRSMRSAGASLALTDVEGGP